MDDLTQQMKVALASTFAFYLKAHNFHWNVEGPGFPQYHALFGDIYTEVWGAVDAIAEHIRTLDSYAPGSLRRFSQLSVIQDQVNIPDARGMLSELQTDNVELITELDKAFRLAEKAGKSGIANFFQDRIDIHEKHGWMLRASSK
jgi:starvation-inducible DNA-binding protein